MTFPLNKYVFAALKEVYVFTILLNCAFPLQFKFGRRNVSFTEKDMICGQEQNKIKQSSL